MKKKIFHNWGLKLASLVLAFILWFLVVQIEDPRDSRTFNNVKVNLINTELLEKENKVYEVLDRSDIAHVTVWAPRSVLKELSASDIVAEADVSKLTDINTIAVKLSVQNVDVEKIEGNPELVRLSVEERATKWVKISKNVTGEVAEGYMVAGSTLDQTQISVTGPKSRVDQISYAAVDFDVTGATNDTSANVEIKLYDAEDRLLEFENVNKNVNYVRMSVSVYAVKEVPIELNYMGEPADGYVLTGIVSGEPTSVMIAGTAFALNNVNAITIPAERLDITDLTESLETTVNIREFLPDNVRLADQTFNGRIAVTIGIDAINTRTVRVPIANISLVNVPEEAAAQYEVVFPEDQAYAELTMSGRQIYLDEVDPAVMTSTIDLTAWMASENIIELKEGTYIIPVEFVTPANVSVDRSAGVRIEVRPLTTEEA